MKKSIFIILLGLFVTENISAQRDSSITKTERQELNKMRKDMNLSDDQKAKVKAIHDQRKASKEARKSASKEERKAINQKDQAAVKEVLTDEQEAKQKVVRKKRREFKKN